METLIEQVIFLKRLVYVAVLRLNVYCYYMYMVLCYIASYEYHDYIPYLLNRDSVASLTLLADMTAQAKTIEILIFHVHEVGTFSLCARGDEVEM